ncbi:hypothetical protein [[Flexibacter] sp. ATCC 35208]|uniref:hypothetical protein n=1 Tax=[Flexibacter] sp. ATCC 35208 TaxID=1936242 RepID=UPI00117C12B9|nr:hypothetical protein [[Flexibacter] sp. ATCC 35208]
MRMSLLQKTTWFLLPCLAFVPLYFWLISRSGNIYLRKEQLLEKHISQVNCLVMGSSHVLHGVNPEYLPSGAFNMGNLSQDLGTDIRIVKRYLNDMKNLHTVAFDIDYLTTFYSMTDRENKWRDYYYNYFMNLDYTTSYNQLRASLHLLEPGVVQYTLQGILLKMMHQRTEFIMPMNTWGYSQRTFSKNINERTGKKRAAAHSKLYSKAFYDQNLQIFRETLAMLHNRHIRVILFSTPVTDFYASNLDPRLVNLQEEFIHEVQQQYALEYGNFTHDKRFNLQDFSDNDHLNNQGAVKFSKILCNELFNHPKSGPPAIAMKR